MNQPSKKREVPTKKESRPFWSDEALRHPEVAPAKWYAERALFLEDEMWAAVEIELSRLSLLTQLDDPEKILAALLRLADKIENTDKSIRFEKYIRLHALALLYEARTFSWQAVDSAFPDAEDDENLLETFYQEETTAPGFRTTFSKSKPTKSDALNSSERVKSNEESGWRQDHTDAANNTAKKDVVHAADDRKPKSATKKRADVSSSSVAGLPLNVWSSFPAGVPEMRAPMARRNEAVHSALTPSRGARSKSEPNDMECLFLAQKLTETMRTARECLDEYLSLQHQFNASETARAHVDSIDRAFDDIRKFGNGFSLVSLASRMETLHEREKNSSTENTAFLKRVKIAYALLLIRTFHDQNLCVARRAHEDMKMVRQFSPEERQDFIHEAAHRLLASSKESRLWWNRQILSRIDADDRDPRKTDGFISAAYLSPSLEVLRTSLLRERSLVDSKKQKIRGQNERQHVADKSYEYELAKAQIRCVLSDSPSQSVACFRDAQQRFAAFQLARRNKNITTEERTNV